MKPKREFLFAFGAVLVAVVLFVPLNNTVAPAVRLQILDEAGTPAVGIRVEQEWDYIVIDSKPHREVSQTDTSGYVSFPRRSVRVSLIRKLLSFAGSLVPHGSEGGPNATISAYGPDARAYDIVICGINDPAPRQMRLKRLDLALRKGIYSGRIKQIVGPERGERVSRLDWLYRRLYAIAAPGQLNRYAATPFDQLISETGQ